VTWQTWNTKDYAGTSVTVNVKIKDNLDNISGAISKTGIASLCIDSYTTMVLHFDWNFNNSTSDTYSITNNSVTFGSGKFWQAAYFAWAGNYLSIASHDWFNFWTEPFTIDMWFKPTTLDGYNMMVSWFFWSSNRYWALSNYQNMLYWYAWDVSINQWPLTVNNWYHAAIVRSWNNIYLYLHWNKVWSTTTIYSPTSDVMCIGGDACFWWPDYFNWYIDEFRISKGIARWTWATYTVPNSPYWQ
jgi:hypothetical protein